MTIKGDPIAQKLDRLAESTGFPKLQRRMTSGNPIRFRLVPLILLAVAAGGLVVQMLYPQGLGYCAILVVWSITLVIFGLGPMRHRSAGKYDERERAVRRQGHFVGLLVAFGVAVVGSVAFGFGKTAAMIGWWDIWAPQSGLDWLAITFFLLALEANVAVLAASAATPEPLQDEDN